jgi:pyridoxal phosphate enzyme (YggS family)
VDHHIADSIDFIVNPAEIGLIDRYQRLAERLRQAESHYGRAEGSVCLVAVSKTYPADHVRTVAAQGQRDFGENQIQDAMTKIPVLEDLGCSWHFIGPIQSNKCRDIALHFDWVHSIDRTKIANRLSDLRPTDAEPINTFIQINLQNEATKSGVLPEELGVLVDEVKNLPNLSLRGLMAIPALETLFDRQRATFSSLRELLEAINREHQTNMDCLSMGMTDDLEAAVAEGATHVRVGTAIFGPRQKPASNP